MVQDGVGAEFEIEQVRGSLLDGRAGTPPRREEVRAHFGNPAGMYRDFRNPAGRFHESCRSGNNLRSIRFKFFDRGHQQQRKVFLLSLSIALKPRDARSSGNNLKRFEDFYLKATALTVLYVPYSLDSGWQTTTLLSRSPRRMDSCRRPRECWAHQGGCWAHPGKC